MNPLSAIPDRVVRQVDSRSVDMCAMRDVVILHAVESGSRAWGFASPDSDYDVRFIYAHRADWYFSVFEQRDVIETPIEEVDDVVLDLNGWDLRKSLRLLAKSNPVLIEWLQSPVVYTTKGNFAAELLGLARRYYSPKAAHFHYFHMARKNFREHLCGESIKLKKYFYVLRPVLACQWIERGLGMPPMQLTKLLGGVAVPDTLRDDVLLLRDRKMRESERLFAAEDLLSGFILSCDLSSLQ